MIEYVNGSLFDSPAQTLVNTVNTVGVMGKGIAAEFKARFPSMFTAYQSACQQRLLTVGKLQLYRSANKWVLNFPTKQHWKNPSQLAWVEAGLEKFVASYTAQGITSVAFPMLGCGNGQLDWRDVKPVMERHLKDVQIPVYVYLRPSVGKPEHLPVLGLEALSEARETVTFLAFWNALRRLTGEEAVQALGDDDADDAWLPLDVEGGATTRLPRDAFEDLFHQLRLRGALRPDKFPTELLKHHEVLSQLLLQLPYVREIEFNLPAVRGVQFSPRRQTQNEALFEAAPA